jgi:hypothetical protein
MRTLVLLAISVAIAAGATAFSSHQAPFEEQVVRTTLAQESADSNSKCPLSSEHVAKADLRALSICVKYGLIAYDSVDRYPAIAQKVFAVYDGEEVLAEILDRYGHVVLPVIGYFVESGSKEFQLREAVGNAWQQLKAGQPITLEIPKITPEQFGLIAMYEIKRRGHEMLAEFELINGVAWRKPGTRLFFGAKDFLVGGLADLEKILVTGKRLPNWKEVGLAALDLTVVAGSMGAIFKATRASVRTAGPLERSTIRVAGEGAMGALAAVGKTTVRLTPIALVYVAVTRPQLLVSAGGWFAEQLGLPRAIGIFGVYTMGILLLLLLIRPLFWCGSMLLVPLRFVVRHT